MFRFFKRRKREKEKDNMKDTENLYIEYYTNMNINRKEEHEEETDEYGYRGEADLESGGEFILDTEKIIENMEKNYISDFKGRVITKTDIKDKSIFTYICKVLKSNGEFIRIEEALKLETLNIENNNEVELDFLRFFSNIEEIKLVNSTVKSFKPLRYLNNLREVVFKNYEDINLIDWELINEIKPNINLVFDNISTLDINALKKFSSLSSCEFSKSQLVNLEQLEVFKSLEGITLYKCESEDFSNFKKIQGLKSLSIVNINKFNYEIINELNLKSLAMQGDNINNISFLRNSESIESLVIRKTNIQDFTDIETMNRLKELRIENNRIDDIRPLARNNNLQKIYLNKTRLSNEKQFECLKSRKNLKLLDLKENYLDSNKLKKALEENYKVVKI